jgi:hypothetical protein
MSTTVETTPCVLALPQPPLLRERRRLAAVVIIVIVIGVVGWTPEQITMMLLALASARSAAVAITSRTAR